MLILQRVKNQARAVKCQANLHQWGLIFSAYTTGNDGRFWPLGYTHLWYNVLEAWRYEDLCFCPMAVKVNPNQQRSDSGDLFSIGSKFTAWEINWNVPPGPRPDGKPDRGSYGLNMWITDSIYYNVEQQFFPKRPANVPVFMDCCLPDDAPRGDYDYEHAPPEYDDAGPCLIIVFPDGISSFCINRHDGGINVLFMDWSVRKVGLKELWTLKWHREFNTKNKWTRAGGVRPTDWPEWMRKFKDY